MSRETEEIVTLVDSAVQKINQMIAKEREAKTACQVPVESVLTLRRQGVSDTQIACSIYGRRDHKTGIFSGPFTDEGGAPDFGLISRQVAREEEIEATGESSIPAVVEQGWVPPWHRDSLGHLQDARKQLADRLEVALARLREPITASEPVKGAAAAAALPQLV